MKLFQKELNLSVFSSCKVDEYLKNLLTTQPVLDDYEDKEGILFNVLSYFLPARKRVLGEWVIKFYYAYRNGKYNNSILEVKINEELLIRRLKAVSSFIRDKIARKSRNEFLVRGVKLWSIENNIDFNSTIFNAFRIVWDAAEKEWAGYNRAKQVMAMLSKGNANIPTMVGGEDKPVPTSISERLAESNTPAPLSTSADIIDQIYQNNKFLDIEAMEEQWDIIIPKVKDEEEERVFLADGYNGMADVDDIINGRKERGEPVFTNDAWIDGAGFLYGWVCKMLSRLPSYKVYLFGQYLKGREPFNGKNFNEAEYITRYFKVLRDSDSRLPCPECNEDGLIEFEKPDGEVIQQCVSCGKRFIWGVGEFLPYKE